MFAPRGSQPEENENSVAVRFRRAGALQEMERHQRNRHGEKVADVDVMDSLVPEVVHRKQVRERVDQADKVPAGLEKQAQEMGYDIVPSSAAPAPADGGLQLGAAMRAQEGSEMSPSQPGTLEVLAERDVEHQLAELTRSRTAKRLEKQAKLEQRLKLEFQAQSDVKKAELREQARAKRAAEHRAAEQADTRYSNMLTFPDQTRKEEMKMLDEHVNGESRKDRQTATERRSAGRRAAAQLAHYNLLSFHEDEFKSPHARAGATETPHHTALSKSPAAGAASELKSPVADMPSALKRATLTLASAEAQIAKDTSALAAAPKSAAAQVRLATRVGARRAGDGKQRASPSARGGDAHTAVRRGEKVHERRGKGGGVEEREASEAEKAIGSDRKSVV